MRFRFSELPLFSAVALFGTVSAFAAVRPADYFSDHMVLQRDRPVPVWGMAEPGEKVTVAFAGQTRSAVADRTGWWQVELAPLKASCEPRTLEISSDNQTIKQSDNQTILSDVLVGDVWFVGGGMNVEMTFGWGVAGADEALAEAERHPAVRMVHGPVGAKSVLPVDCETGLGKWTTCTKQTLPGLSAVSYFFARELNKASGIPVGVVYRSTAWTGIEGWLPTEGLEDVPGAAKYFAQQKKAMSDLMAGESPFSVFHHAMVAPLGRLPFAGGVWYEGETSRALDYGIKLRVLLTGWRMSWGRDFPVAVVAVRTPGASFDQIRRQQREAVAALPATALISTMDLPYANGEYFTKGGKLEIGQRLAAWARKGGR